LRWKGSRVWLVPFVLGLLFLAPTTPTRVLADTAPRSETITREEIQPRLNEIYGYRAGLVITGADVSGLADLYLPGSRTAQWALDHERNRARYMQLWATNRGVRIVESQPEVKISWFRPRGETVQLGVVVSLRLGYSYPDEEAAGVVNHFGVGTRHWLELVKKDGTWLIRREWYTDPLGDDTLVYRPTPAVGKALPDGVDPTPPPLPEPVEGRSYNRLQAAAYADKYAGSAWGAGNDGKYNSRYRDYNGIGGDCTNYVSQAIGDKKEGGGLRQDGSWHYGGGGSVAWVQTDAFARWLQYSGRAKRIAKGKYSDVTTPSDKFPKGALRELQIGDIIAFDEKNDVQHFSIITAFDSKGYPLVNTHTADRWHVPWDLGWDKSAVFWLFRLND